MQLGICCYGYNTDNTASSEPYTVVSRIYAPRFATLALVESVGGAYTWDLTIIIYLVYTPPLPGPRLDVDIATLSLQKHGEPCMYHIKRTCIMR